MSNTTEKQARLLSYIKNYTSHHGYAPSLREMADHMGLGAVSTVHQHLAALRRKGLVDSVSKKDRNIRVHNIPKLFRIPLLGEIAAGLPIEPLEDPEPVFVSTDLVKSPHGYYALKVCGNSMIEDNIENGDTVIIKSQSYLSSPKDTIVAIVNGGATLKRFGGIDENGQVTLLPRNSGMKPIIVDSNEFEVRGVLVGLVRSV